MMAAAIKSMMLQNERQDTSAPRGVMNESIYPSHPSHPISQSVLIMHAVARPFSRGTDDALSQNWTTCSSRQPVPRRHQRPALVLLPFSL